MKIIFLRTVVPTLLVFNFGCTSQKKINPETDLRAGLAESLVAKNITDNVVTRTAQVGNAHEQELLAEVRAEITNIDKGSRELTLIDEGGNTFKYKAGPEVKRFDELHVGDIVMASLLQTLFYELRDPTPEERANPRVEFTTTDRTPNSLPPGIGQVKTIKAVVTVKDINLDKQLITVAGPTGNKFTAKIFDISTLKALKLDQVVIATYSEAVAVSVEPVGSSIPTPERSFTPQGIERY
jgi:hypothetical protein